MKQSKSKSAVKPQQDIPAAEARAKAAKERARQARARLKQARKAARQAKKAAKSARKNSDQARKALRKLIRKAEKAAVRKLITPVKKKAPSKAVKPPAPRKRRFVVRASPVVLHEPPVVEALPDSGSSSGGSEQGVPFTQ